MIYTVGYGMVRRRFVVVLHPDIANPQFINESELQAILAHEIDHALSEPAWRSFATLLGVLMGQPRGFLFLTNDQSDNELAADRTAFSHMGGKQPLISALHHVRIMQSVHMLCESRVAQNISGWQAVFEPIDWFYGSTMLTSSYPTALDRIEELENLDDRPVPLPPPRTSWWKAPILHWMVAAGLFTVPIITTLALSDTQRPDIKAPAFTPITVAGGVGDLRAIAIVYETIYLATGAGLVTADVSDLETGLISGRPNPVLENLSDVLIDGDTIWISSYDDGVAQMDSGGWTLHTSAGLLPSVVVSGITRTDDGSIWFATGAGLLQIFPDGSSAVHFAKLGFYDVESSGLQLAAVSSKLLVQTEDVTDGAFDTFTISNMGFYAYDYYRTDQYFASISYDHDDLWILTDGSLVKFDASGNQFFWTPLNSCSGCASQASVISANGTFFVGFGSGVAMIPIGADPDGIDSWTEFEGERDFPGSKVRELFSLSNEIILAATDAGLVRINTAAPYLSSSIGYINAVPFASPQVVEVVSSEEYWVGTHGQIFQYLSGEWYPVELSIDMGLIKDLDLAPDGTLWVASLGGLIAVDTFTRTSKIIDGHLELGLSSPNSVAVSADGAVWVAFASGSKGSSTDIWVGRLHNGNWTTPKCPMGRNGLFYLGADSSGLVWAASSTGDLMRVDTGECQILDIGDLTFVMDLEVRADKVYVADGSRGVFVYDTASRSAELIEIDPLINAIDVGKDGQIWLATYDGVALIEGGDVDYFHFKDGIPSSYVTDVSIAQDGTLVVATANGLAIMAAGQNDASN